VLLLRLIAAQARFNPSAMNCAKERGHAQFRIRFWTVSDAGAVVLDQLQISSSTLIQCANSGFVSENAMIRLSSAQLMCPALASRCRARVTRRRMAQHR